MRYLVALATILAGFAQGADPTGRRIVIDGAFDDWAQVAATSDGPDSSSRAMDFEAIRVVGDDRFIAVLVDTVRPVPEPGRAGLPGSLILLVDEDATPTTGRKLHGMAGVDVEIVANARGKAGWEVRRSGPGGEIIQEPLSSVGLTLAPKFESTRFEIRFERAMAGGVGAPATRAVVKILYVEDGVPQDDAGPVILALPPVASPRRPWADERVPIDDPLRRAPGTTLRVVVWNVARLPSQKPPAVAATVFRGLDPDLLMLTELAAPSSNEVVAMLPTGGAPNASPWRVAMNGELAVAFRGAVEDLFGPPLMPPETRFYETLWELLFGRVEIPSMGTVAVQGHRRILAVPLHLACCGAQPTRAIQAPIIRGEVQNAMARAHPSAVIIAGDFNLLGSRSPLDVLRNGTGPGGSSLAVVDALQLDGLSNDTWRSRGGTARGPHVPSRLDWMLYSRSSLELLQAFVFDSRDLSPYWLRHHGIAEDASDRTSDHLPIVADFTWRR